MPLNTVDLTAKLKPLEWQVGGLLLKGNLNTVASLPGEGKSAVLTGLAWQASRPGGGTFAGRKVWPGATLYVDYDAPGEGRSLRYWLDKHRKAFPDGDMNKITLLEPDADTYGLQEGEMAQLTEIAHEKQASFIIIDSFTSAFPGTDPIKLTSVSGPLWYLRRLATELNACVVLIEHMPKPMHGEKAGARGILGSIVKKAQARSVYLLTRVAPKEVEGRHVLKWTCDKLSYAAMPEPFGLELVFNDGALTMEQCELPAEYAETKGDKATRAMQNHLVLKRGEVVPRQDLLHTGVTVANVHQRTAVEALKALEASLGDELEKVQLPGKGQPVGYRLKAEDAQEPHSVCTKPSNALKPVQDAKHLMQPALHQMPETASNAEPVDNPDNGVGDAPEPVDNPKYPEDTRFKDDAPLFDDEFSRRRENSTLPAGFKDRSPLFDDDDAVDTEKDEWRP